MTELHIERKERSAWPWAVAGLLLLALLLWFLFGRADGRGAAVTEAGGAIDSAPVATATTAGAEELPAAISEFVRFAEARSGSDANLSHDYTADGLRRLADALGAVTEGATVSGVDVQERLSAIRARADAMQRDPTSTGHALQAREAFLLASGLMRQLQEARFTGLTNELREVNDAATALQPDRLLLEQTTEVQRFFERAAHAIREMVRAA